MLIVIIPVNIIIAASITMTMAYRSAVMVWELQATRAQLLRISRTDPLTGLLNRRGYDEAAVAGEHVRLERRRQRRAGLR